MTARTFVTALATVALLIPASAAAAAADDDRPDPLRIARERIAAEIGALPTTEARAVRLAELAFIDDPAAAPLRAHEARQKLVSYGANAVPALRAIVTRVDPVYSVDVAATLLELRWNFSGAGPSEYRPALTDMMWFGSTEAKRLLIPWAARYRLRYGLLPSIDAALLEPDALLERTVRFIHRFGDVRARFFLADLLRDGEGELREMAARQLAEIGAEAHDVLRDAMLSDDRRTRELAIDSLLPVSGVEDLTGLYEYVGRHRETDPPERIERIVERAALLERILSSQMDAEAASAEN